MFDVYKLSNPIQPEYQSVEQAHIQYLFDIAIDRVDGCEIDGREFVETPRVFDRHYTNSSTQTVTVITINEEDTFVQGSILYYDSDYWLCVSCFRYQDQYLKGLFQRCNYLLKWQNAAGEIIERHVCVQDASSYSSGVDGNKTLHYGNDQVMVYVTCDEESVIIQRDKRFMIDVNGVEPTTYTLTRVDTVSRTVNGVGYCIWLMTESQLDEQADNSNLMICDYVAPIPKPTPDVIKYIGQPQIRVGGVAKKFTADTTSTVTWSLILLTQQEGHVQLENTGTNQCKIKCDNAQFLIGTSFKLVATWDTNKRQELLIDLVGGV